MREAVKSPHKPVYRGPGYVRGKLAVLDVDGHAIWKVRVAREEMTCLDCGETTTGGFCNRCTNVDVTQEVVPTDEKLGRNLVPTLSYLREADYVLI